MGLVFNRSHLHDKFPVAIDEVDIDQKATAGIRSNFLVNKNKLFVLFGEKSLEQFQSHNH